MNITWMKEISHVLIVGAVYLLILPVWCQQPVKYTLLQSWILPPLCVILSSPHSPSVPSLWVFLLCPFLFFFKASLPGLCRRACAITEQQSGMQVHFPELTHVCTCQCKCCLDTCSQWITYIPAWTYQPYMECE